MLSKLSKLFQLIKIFNLSKTVKHCKTVQNCQKLSKLFIISKLSNYLRCSCCSCRRCKDESLSDAGGPEDANVVIVDSVNKTKHKQIICYCWVCKQNKVSCYLLSLLILKTKQKQIICYRQFCKKDKYNLFIIDSKNTNKYVICL